MRNKSLVGAFFTINMLTKCACCYSAVLIDSVPFIFLLNMCSEVHGEMVQKILDILRFLWAIVLAMVDGLTRWLNLLTKQYSDTSTVLCNERYFSIHKIEQVNTNPGTDL